MSGARSPPFPSSPWQPAQLAAKACCAAVASVWSFAGFVGDAERLTPCPRQVASQRRKEIRPRISTPNGLHDFQIAGQLSRRIPDILSPVENEASLRHGMATA